MIKYIIGIAILLFILCSIFPLVQICGYSMFPTLMDGEFYIGRRVFRKSKCKLGEIYVYRPPYNDREEKFVIKRLKGVEYTRTGSTRYFFLGDNPDDSYDSRYYGYVDSKNVVAHIVKKRGVK